MQRVVIVDIGMGNLRSVERAVAEAASRKGIACEVSRRSLPEEIASADKVVMPGQGAFRDCAARLDGPLGEALRETIRRGTPYLGICLGLQVLFERSEEAPGAAGLGTYRGEVKRLVPGEGGEGATPLKIPHMGWNRLEQVNAPRGPLAIWEKPFPHVYFVHSYHPVPEDSSLLVYTVSYGPNRITAAIQRDNVTATQFHPEKSQGAGLDFLGAFMAL